MIETINLQLLAENVQTTLLENLSPEIKTYYDMTLLDEAEPALVHQQFGQKRPIPKGSGKTIEFRIFESFPKALTALTEGATPPGRSLKATAKTAEVKQYGDYVTMSDILELTAIDPIVQEAVKLCGGQAGRTIDTVVRDAMLLTTNISYCSKEDGTEVTDPTNLDFTCQLTVKEVQKAVAKLRAQNAQDKELIYHEEHFKQASLIIRRQWKVIATLAISTLALAAMVLFFLFF